MSDTTQITVKTLSFGDIESMDGWVALGNTNQTPQDSEDTKCISMSFMTENTLDISKTDMPDLKHICVVLSGIAFNIPFDLNAVLNGYHTINWSYNPNLNARIFKYTN
jgi:hypothetical protein